MAKRPSVRKRRSPRLALGLLVVGVLLVALFWARPWADSAMTASITVSTDEGGTVTAYETKMIFSGRGDSRPVRRAVLDLSPWEGQLIRLDVRGGVTPRAANGGASGSVGCALELLEPNATRALEFVGWQQGSRQRLHLGPVGPRAMDLDAKGEQRFAVATKGTLWHVLEVPPDSRLRIYLKPVLALDMPDRPRPFVPETMVRESSPIPPPARQHARPPDVFIYLIDALRADHLGCYGYQRPTSPVIDAFAAEATLYENAHTASTWTRPSVATMLSGLYASVHGAMHESDALAEWPLLLPEMLHEAGYNTWCITTNGNIVSRLGYNQGYDEFIFVDQAPAEWVNMFAGRRLAKMDPDQLVFMYLHTVEPHGPYTPTPESFRLFDRGLQGRCDGSLEACIEVGILRPELSEVDVGHLLDLYDGEVYDADKAFAKFLDLLHRTGRYDNSLIVLLSDHGESFSEHDTMGHGWNLNQEDMRVMLVVKFPGGRFAGLRVKHPVSLVDLLPTVLSSVGLRPALDYELPGRDLARTAEVPDADGARRIYGEVSQFDSNDLDLGAVIDEDGYKRVMDVSVAPRETATKKSLGLWDTHSDPNETTDLSVQMPVRAAYGEQLIARWLLTQSRWRERLSSEPPPRIEIDDELRDRLRALGYFRGASNEDEAAPAKEGGVEQR